MADGCRVGLSSASGSRPGGEQQPRVGHGDARPVDVAPVSLREALTFFAPFLAQFRLTASHAMAYMAQKPGIEQWRAAIFGSERQKRHQEAVSHFLDWILSMTSPEILSSFFSALQEGTDEHRRVYGLLVASSIYLPVHQQLIAVLTEKLQQGSMEILPLLDHLTQHDLLQANHRKGIILEFDRWLTAQSPASAGASEARGDQDPQHAEGTTESGSNVPTAPATPELVAKRLLASLYYKQVEVLTSGRSGMGRREIICERCTREAEGRSAQDSNLWTDLLACVLDADPNLSGLSRYLPDEATSRRLWANVRERVSSIEMQPPDRDDEAETSEHDASASSSRSDSGDTVVEKLEGFMATADKLERVREQRTEQFVHDVNAKFFRKTVTRGLVDDDCSISVFSETATISTTSDNNPAANLPPFVPRTGGVLQQDEVERLRRGEITLRPYQEELLVSARNGSNVLINLPTGTGKTYLVLKYAQEHLTSGGGRRLGFVVPRVRLAQQQHERFEHFLPQFKPYLRCGETTGTSIAKTPWKQLLETSSIFVMTAECLVQAVEQGHVSLSDFSLLVLDECHHARGGHPLRNLMNLYMDLKFSRPAGSVRLPQIMGLTASPGVGRAQGGDAEKALDYLLHLCARLDVQEICTVRDNKDDLAMYAHEPKHELHQSGKRKKDKFKDEIEKFMKDVETLMCTHEDVKRYTHSDRSGKERLQGDLGPPVSHRGDSQYTEWAHGLENRLKEVTSDRAYYVLMACAEMLKLLQRALILNEDCESWYALDFLKKEVERRRAERPETASVDHDLYNKFTEQVPVLEAHCNRGSSPRNPKLRLLKKLILKSTSTQDTEGQDLDAPTPDGSGFNIQATAEPDPPGVDVATDPQETLRKTSSIPQPQEGTDTQNETGEAYAPFQYHGHNIISRPWISLNMGREQILDNARWIAEQELSQTTLKQFLSDRCEFVRERQDIGQEDQATGFSETELNRLDEGKLLNDGTQDILRDADDVDLSDTDSEPDSEWNWALDKDVRGMIFVRTLDLSKALVEWIKQDPKLCHLNPGRITGVNASVKDGGMTKSEVTDVMSNFNAGHHKLVVCTSAAEEGLDFTACNLVIRYDYVTSMVSMIQTRGRARQKDSRYCVMGDLASGNKAKEEANLATESLMHDAVARFQKEVDKNLGAHLDKLARMQKDAHNKRWSQEVAEARRDKQKMPTGFYKLLCGKCKEPACTSRMIRLLKKTNRVVIGTAFSQRYERRDGQKKKEAYDKDIPPTGTDLHCKHCGNRWGIFVRSVADNIEFPVITIRSFLIHDEKGEVHKKEKWCQAFDVPNLTEEDRERHVQANGSALDDEEERVINNADEEDLEREGREQVLSTGEESFARDAQPNGTSHEGDEDRITSNVSEEASGQGDPDTANAGQGSQENKGSQGSVQMNMTPRGSPANTVSYCTEEQGLGHQGVDLTNGDLHPRQVMQNCKRQIQVDNTPNSTDADTVTIAREDIPQQTAQVTTDRDRTPHPETVPEAGVALAEESTLVRHEPASASVEERSSAVSRAANLLVDAFDDFDGFGGVDADYFNDLIVDDGFDEFDDLYGYGNDDYDDVDDFDY